MKRAKVISTAEVFEDKFFDGCKIDSVTFSPERRILIFHLHDDRFEDVPAGCEPHNYSLIHTFDGEVRFEK